MTTPRIKIKNQSVAAIEAELLKRVRLHGHISRVALSRELHIVPSTAGIYVDRLLAEGYLQESRKAAPGPGRPATLLTLKPGAGRFVGLDFEARNLMATAVDFSQRPLRQIHETVRAADSVEQILRKMERAIAQVMAHDPRPVLGIGIGVPGIIDPVHGVAVRYDLIKGWHDIHLGARLRKKFRAPVFLENNVRCMALAELWFGQGRGLKDFICLGVRSGIAAGVVVNGQLLRGVGNQAGEIGHWSAPVPALLADTGPSSGNGKCHWQAGVPMEQIASLSSVVRIAECGRQDGQATSLAAISGELSIYHWFNAVWQGDAFARSLVRPLASVHGWAVWQLCALFDPQKIIFTGPLTELGELFLEPVRAAVARWSGAKLKVEITGSTLGTYNGALGAAALALHQWKPKR